jgi:hypothetical protein
MAPLKDNPKRYRPQGNDYAREWKRNNTKPITDAKRAYNKEYYAKNREKRCAAERARYAKKNATEKQQIFARNRQNYAITGKSPAAKQRESLRYQTHRRNLELLVARPKPDACEVCGNIGRIVFDHCHRTKNFRGWLCNGCNTALGYVNDDPDRLRMLASYLERAKHPQD